MPLNKPSSPALPWVDDKTPLPPPEQAWGAQSPAPGLLAAGGRLDTPILKHAYQQGCFPWYSDNQPILWWSPDPRMVLYTDAFEIKRSLKKILKKFIQSDSCEIRFDSCFSDVIEHCAHADRAGQNGTWILPEMIDAYVQFHRDGFAHSVEVWENNQLIGGLYGVCIGKAMFGESIFSLQTDASKIALAALVAFCKTSGIQMIDCQQNTRHLASLGGQEITRADFLFQIAKTRELPSPNWRFDPLYWNQVIPSPQKL